MLANEICYALLDPHFKCGPHPLPRGEDLSNGYVTYQDISIIPEMAVDGWLGFDQVRVQINVFNKQGLKASQDANRIKRIFTKENSYSGCVVIGQRSDFDAETMLYFQQIDFYLTQSDSC